MTAERGTGMASSFQTEAGQMSAVRAPEHDGVASRICSEPHGIAGLKVIRTAAHLSASRVVLPDPAATTTSGSRSRLAFPVDGMPGI
jgi:hypothetical protein